MKTVPLRTLLREPRKIKRWTKAGETLQITDNGRPLWIVQPADGTDEDDLRLQETNAILDEVLHGPMSSMRLSKIIKESRR